MQKKENRVHELVALPLIDTLLNAYTRRLCVPLGPAAGEGGVGGL